MNAQEVSIGVSIKRKYERLLFQVKPWDIEIIVKRRQGNRFTMEDYAWFEPPFKRDGRQYIQCFVLDGHSTHPLELQSFYSKAKQLIHIPFDSSTMHHWQSMVKESDQEWSTKGGLVIHIVSISYQPSEPKLITIQRGQIGDCNSIVLQSNEICLPMMEVHNTSNREEYKRVEPWCVRGRVGGVLECTRVIGNKDIKQKMEREGAPMDMLTPIFLKEKTIHCIRDNHWMTVVGTDGLFGDVNHVETLIGLTQKMMSHLVQIETIARVWLGSSSPEDNVAFVLLAFKYRAP